MHKESGQKLAIKQVPVDSDLQDIIKEISIMQQCDSAYVVKYYGSYFKNTDLWIVMEYCGGGSVSDIMRIINRPVRPPPPPVLVMTSSLPHLLADGGGDSHRAAVCLARSGVPALQEEDPQGHQGWQHPAESGGPRQARYATHTHTHTPPSPYSQCMRKINTNLHR